MRGLNIVSTAATGLSGGAVAGVNVSEASVTSNTGTAVNLNGTGGTVRPRPASRPTAAQRHRAEQHDRHAHGDRHWHCGYGRDDPNSTTRGASFINASNISLTNMNFTNASQNDGPTAPDGVVGGNSDENGAIHLPPAANVALTGVTITTTAQHGINGNAVKGACIFTTVTISGTGNEVWELGDVYL